MKEILFYKMPSGKSPIDDFLNSLSSKEAQKSVSPTEMLNEQKNKHQYLMHYHNNFGYWLQ